MSAPGPRFFAVKVTVGQERNVARIVDSRITPDFKGIYAILVLPDIRGYIFIEAESKEKVSMITQGIRHVKGRPIMVVKKDELMPHLIEKPVIETISLGDIVEIISGPLQGISGKVVRVDKPKNEVTIEPSDAAFPLPISVPADQVRVTKSKEVG
ncbi:MAG: transcription elongation factor Spt5 [Thaumarchaeota archaeon]|nr:MAG: transcription elongation factor Spt5 [Nitrososphaerota archaeon]